MPMIESQKAAEDSQNKQNINGSRGFILLLKQLANFPISWNKQVLILDKAMTFSLYNK